MLILVRTGDATSRHSQDSGGDGILKIETETKKDTRVLMREKP